MYHSHALGGVAEQPQRQLSGTVQIIIIVVGNRLSYNNNNGRRIPNMCDCNSLRPTYNRRFLPCC